MLTARLPGSAKLKETLIKLAYGSNVFSYKGCDDNSSKSHTNRTFMGVCVSEWIFYVHVYIYGIYICVCKYICI